MCAAGIIERKAFHNMYKDDVRISIARNIKEIKLLQMELTGSTDDQRNEILEKLVHHQDRLMDIRKCYQKVFPPPQPISNCRLGLFKRNRSDSVNSNSSRGRGPLKMEFDDIDDLDEIPIPAFRECSSCGKLKEMYKGEKNCFSCEIREEVDSRGYEED